MIIVLKKNLYCIAMARFFFNYSILICNFFSATESRTIVECDGGENVTNRVIDDDEEDEREDVAMV